MHGDCPIAAHGPCRRPGGVTVVRVVGVDTPRQRALSQVWVTSKHVSGRAAMTAPPWAREAVVVHAPNHVFGTPWAPVGVVPIPGRGVARGYVPVK